MQVLCAGLVLPGGRQRAAALRGGLILQLHQPRQCRSVHRDRRGPLCANGQHAADAMQPRHGCEHEGVGHLFAVRGWQLHERERPVRVPRVPCRLRVHRSGNGCSPVPWRHLRG